VTSPIAAGNSDSALPRRGQHDACFSASSQKADPIRLAAKDLESADIDPHLMRCVLLAQWRFRSPPMMAFRLVEPHARAVPKQFYFLL
jgi:hypothetical protein